MKRVVVTTGQPFTDIDALACAIAYTELLNLKGMDATAYLPGPLNKSVTEKIKFWDLVYSTTHHPLSTIDYSFVLVDISEPEYFATAVVMDKVVEVFDHRKGFEKYWEEKLGKDSHIELVGSCATLIWEEFIKAGKENQISPTAANLLFTAIASNTLNFRSFVTTKRDHEAFEQLQNFTKLPKNWIESYFTTQDKEVLENIYGAIVNDTKNLEPIMGQLELWDGKNIVKNNLPEIERALKSFGKENWFLTSPSISEGKNYLYTKVPAMKDLLEKTIDASFVGDVGTTNKLWLRKEIIARINRY